MHATIYHERARILRKNLTDAERKLWFFLRKKQLSSFRFRRQVPMGGYIVDFVCLEVKVIIELDGGQHGESQHIIYDQRRTKWLEEQGYQVLRFWNNQIFSMGRDDLKANAVLEVILKSCLSRRKMISSL